MKIFRILAITLLIAVGLSVMTSCSVEIGGFRISPIPNPDDIAHNLKMLGIIENDSEGDTLNDGEGEQITIEFRPGNIFDKPSYDADGRPSDGTVGTDSCKHDWSEDECEAARHCLDCGIPQPPTYDENDIQQLAYQCVGALSVQDADTNKWGGDLAVLIDMGDNADYDTIVTTYHSLSNAKAATFHLGENSYEVSEILGYNAEIDLAFLKIEKTGIVDLPHICYEYHENEQTVYVSEAMAKVVEQGVLHDSEHIENGVVYIEYTKNTDYDFVGGALFNGYGEIIGINTVLDASDNDYSYAISVRELENVSTDSPVTFEELLELQADNY